MSGDKPATDAQAPFIIHYVAGRYLIFSLHTLKQLREKHHICGVLIGTLPQISQQNVFLGRPQQIMVEEAAYLVRHGFAYIVDDQAVHRDTVAAITPADLDKHIAEKALQELGKDMASREMKEQRRRAALEKKGLSHLLADLSLQDIQRKQDDAQQPRSTHVDTVSRDIIYRPPLSSGASDAAIQPNPPKARYDIFEYLHDQGYFLTPGLRFGAQFVAYPGDPLRFHSHYVASGHDWESPIPMMDIVAGGRLGTGVKKAWLVGAMDPDEDKYQCFTVEWAGM